MGKKDIGKREVKKLKKDARKLPSAIGFGVEPTPEVEVIKRGKKDKEVEE